MGVGIGTAVTIGSALFGAKRMHDMNKEAKKVEKQQKRQVEQQRQQALNERIAMIDNQREQMLGAGDSELKGSGSIVGSSGTGLTGKIKTESLG